MKYVAGFSLYLGVSYYTSVGVGLLILTFPTVAFAVRSWIKNYQSTTQLNRLLQEKAAVGLKALGATPKEIADGA